MESGYLYNDRLNLLDWKGCADLWRHKGLGADRRLPKGFRTVGIPGILVALSIEEPLGVAQDRLDDLVRAYVSDRMDFGYHEFAPIFILGVKDNGALHVAHEEEQTWLFDHYDFGWVGFSNEAEADEWIINN